MVSSTDRDVLVAIDDSRGDAVGMIVISDDSVGEVAQIPVLNVTHLVVSPQHRRRGVGRALLAATVHLADQRQIENIVATAVTGSREANRYLARLGFAPLVVRRSADARFAPVARPLGFQRSSGATPPRSDRASRSEGSRPDLIASRLATVGRPGPHCPPHALDSALVTAVDSPPRLLLLDGHSLAYRAFYALPVENFSTTTGQPTNAVYGFTAMLINLLRDEDPTHLAVAFDVSRKTFRAETYAEYKAGRGDMPADFRGQLSLIQEVLEALRIPSLSVEGYEADDVIATLTTQAADEGVQVLICTGDRDVLQLVTDAVTCSTRAGG